ncbi:hypothetical protein LCGC14_0800000 [marine sediment metagenome]|uniref:PEP-CTERM protein-sorting domain-containing protein n=1 Tax=marine sediment metagenome TaxID=412755 RepID=A0A0F9PUH2_9ZZZZ
MTLFKQMLTATALIFSISGVASASSYHSHHYNHGCGDDASTCDNLQQYSQNFTTTDFDVTKNDKYFFGFDALVAPADNFKITSATLTINTNSNGLFDYLYAFNDGFLTQAASISKGGSTTFSLGSSLFDDILAGINFKAWFSLGSESISQAMLNVNGEYCPPEVSEVPVPAAAFLFAPALLGFMGLRRKTKSTIA